MFDVLTYEKGCAVLRMLEQYLGAETFRDGIRQLPAQAQLRQHRTTDLWDALEEVSGEPVRDVMDTWILQGGYPLVTLSDGTITQQPFAYGPPDRRERDRLVVEGPGDDPFAERRRADAAPARRRAPRRHRRGTGRAQRRRLGLLPIALRAHRLDGPRRRTSSDLDELERADAALGQSWAALFAEPDQPEQFLDDRRGTRGPKRADAVGHGRRAPMDIVDRALDADQRAALRDARCARSSRPQFARLGWDAKPSEDELTPQLRALVISTLGDGRRRRGRSGPRR